MGTIAVATGSNPEATLRGVPQVLQLVLALQDVVYAGLVSGRARWTCNAALTRWRAPGKRHQPSESRQHRQSPHRYLVGCKARPRLTSKHRTMNRTLAAAFPSVIRRPGVRVHRRSRPWCVGPMPGFSGGRGSGFGAVGSSFARIAFSGVETRHERVVGIIDRLAQVLASARISLSVGASRQCTGMAPLNATYHQPGHMFIRAPYLPNCPGFRPGASFCHRLAGTR
jgi:hypothetical protein